MEYTNSQIREIICEHVHNMRDREVMQMRLIDGMTLEQIAYAMNISVSTVKRTIFKNSYAIFKHVPQNEP